MKSLRSEVTVDILILQGKTEYSSSILGRGESLLDYIIDELYPMLVEDGQKVYFVHPIILSALAALDRAHTIRDKNKTFL